MPDRKVRLVIEVDDKDVAATTDALQKMGVAAKAASGDDGLGAMTGAMTKAHVSGTLLADAIEKVPEIFEKVVHVGLEVTKVAVELTHKFDEYGESIRRAQQLTGMSAETLSAMEAQTRRTGISFTELGEGMKMFTKLIGDANNSSRDAEAKMKRLGLEPVKAAQDLDAAFSQAIKRIVELPTAATQANAAMDAFGEQGYKLLPFLKSFHGDTEELIKKMKELGVVLSTEDVSAAHEGEEAFKDLADAVRGVGFTFAREFGPVVTPTLKDFTSAIKENRTEIAAWSTSFANFFAGLIGGMRDTVKFVQEHPILVRVLLGASTLGASESAYAMGKAITTLGENERNSRSTLMDGPSVFDFGSGPNDYFSPKPDKPAKLPRTKSSHVNLHLKDDMDDALAIASHYGLIVTSGRDGKHNFGTHGEGRAIDLRTNGVDPSAIEAAMRAFRAAGYNVADERNGPAAPGLFRTGAHIHVGSPRGGRAQAKRVDNFIAGGDKEIREQSDMLTKQDRDAFLDLVLDLWQRFGLMPGPDAVRELRQRAVERARAAGQSTFGVTGFDPRSGGGMIGEFGGPIGSDSPLGIGVTGRDSQRSLQEDYIHNLRIQLGLETDNADELNRGQQYLVRKDMLQQEINAKIDDERQTLKDRALDAEVELGVLQKRNLAEEAGVALMEQRVQLVKEAGDREIGYLLDIQRAQDRLSHSMEINNNEIRAGVYQHMAQMKSLSEAMVDGINQTYDAILGRMNAPLDRLNNKTGGLLSFITEPMKAMQAQALNSVVGPIMDKLFPGFTDAQNPMLAQAKRHTQLLEQIAANTGGLPIGYNPTTGGGGISGIFGGIFGHGPNAGGQDPMGGPDPNSPYILHMGGSGSPYALGSQASGHEGSGGIGAIQSPSGGWRSMFAPQKNPITGKMNSSTAGIMGGIGSIASMIGGFVPGRGGRMLQYAGMGAQIGSLFGPWGAIIGAGAGAILGLFGHRDHAESALRNAVSSVYGIQLKDKSIINQLKMIGEAYFGKGNIEKNATAIVATDEARDLLMNYAEATGQHSKKLENMFHTDPNWSGNQFSSSFSGYGSGMMASGGMSVNRTILPAKPSMSVSGGAAAYLPVIMASHAEALHRVADQMERFQTMPADHVLMAGTQTDRGRNAVSDANRSAASSDPYRRESSARTGQY